MEINKCIILSGKKRKFYATDPVSGIVQVHYDYRFEATAIQSENVITELNELIQNKDENSKKSEYEMAAQLRAKEWGLIFSYINLKESDIVSKNSWNLGDTMVYLILNDGKNIHSPL